MGLIFSERKNIPYVVWVYFEHLLKITQDTYFKSYSNFFLYSLPHYLRSGMGKLSSEVPLSLWNAISCPLSRQLSLVTFKGDYAILALRNNKMQAEKRYSYLTLGTLWKCNL